MSEKCKCPYCDYEINAHSPLTDPATIPKPGYVCICFNCYSINKYNEELQLVEMSQEEKDSLPGELMMEIESIIEKIKKNK